MSAEDCTEAPNWLAKLEEQREKRLKAKLGHEAGAGAPCQNCGDKCPGLDLHFWRKICKLCKCGKEDHDISDDDIYGFVQFQLLGNKPSKAKSIFLAGKKDAITLDWTPKGSNNDVKKYLEELPEELLPVKGSEAARVRKQRLQKQLPAHDIDASLCHALSPEEIQQLEEYVAHIRKHSVGQGKIIQLPLLRSEQHKFSSANSQFLNQQTPGQLASSHPVYLQPSNLTHNLQNLSLHDKQPPNRAAFLNSQIPQSAILNTIDEQRPEAVKYNENVKMHQNFCPKTIHQVVDTQNPVPMGKTSDLIYPIHANMPENNQYSKPEYVFDNSNPQNVIASEKYYNQSPEFAGKMAQNPKHLTSLLGNMPDPILSENREVPHKIPHQNIDNPQNYDRNIDKYKVPNINLVHSTQMPHQILGKNLNKSTPQFGSNPENLDQHLNKIQLGQGPLDPNAPIMNQNLDILGNKGYGTQNYPRDPFMGKNEPGYNLERSNPQDANLGTNYLPKNPEFAKILGKQAPLDYNPDIRDPNYPLNVSENVQTLPLTTSNVERHQEQFLNQDYPKMVLNDSEFKNRVPIPVFSAENKINPLEYEQNLSSVGYIRDIDYNIPKIPTEADLVNSNLVSTCHKCKKPFEEGSFAVSVDRTDSLWHSDCFKCHTCAQPLADLLYFYHKETDDIYCGRDYALLKGIPRCAACDELIFVREYCLAEDRTFHIKHFCCFECDEPLAGKQYVMENNQPNCVDCYEKLKAEKCTDCGYVIGPEEQGVSLQGLHWHANDSCFVCKYCRKGLLGGKMLLRNQNLFCSDVCFKTYHA